MTNTLTDEMSTDELKQKYNNLSLDLPRLKIASFKNEAELLEALTAEVNELSKFNQEEKKFVASIFKSPGEQIDWLTSELAKLSKEIRDYKNYLTKILIQTEKAIRKIEKWDKKLEVAYPEVDESEHEIAAINAEITEISFDMEKLNKLIFLEHDVRLDFPDNTIKSAKHIKYELSQRIEHLYTKLSRIEAQKRIQGFEDVRDKYQIYPDLELDE